MVYSPELRQGVGDLRRCLEEAGLGRQGAGFAKHGSHSPAPDAPLILVACSGGRDSTALAALASIVCPELGLKCGAVVINHGLQEGSAQVAGEAAHRCSSLGLDPVVTERVQVTHTKAGMEADARSARYQAIGRVALAAGARAVLLAHTRDDQAEGVLISLIRTAGLGALAGMAPRSRRGGVLYLRPLLDVSRSQTTTICRQMGLDWWDDPSNGGEFAADQRLPANYPLRSRVRHDLLPALSAFAGRDMAMHLAQSALLARADQDFLDQEAGRLLTRSLRPRTAKPQGAEPLACLDVKTMQDAHPALRSRAWAQLLTSLGLDASSRRIGQIDALVSRWHGQGPVSLPSFHSAFRQGHVILICKDRDHAHR
ncbi:tRNA(Ile)-lysidine synthase [Bifidobacterium actinocoloniiforme DSM 22766]|uniref:tRNA(Ile)-lysidine synthase n=1 Tax=Bifidobacterium actinocoloniiforme DSM 22766 TaxID=1437605 RepID=A0A086Z1N9_9BIFI|nr:tRNA lysidine(34) synthetase TilS [Bifidobacterium actinocoloniiforme]AKV55560.1 hypothetical protein AB656_04315 [Bifidobacterium actinocoloniiforme DSM 22766]KFI40439.1 tRNA(Ile)-lysidine synthase [Bifidobacterium actinocoloniiforme DSM 22766]